MKALRKIWRVVGYLLRSDSGRRHPLRVLARFGRLQMWRKLRRDRFEFRTVTGTCAAIWPDGNFEGLSLLYYFELPDHEENAFGCHLLRSGDVFWDIGANLGYWCVLLAGREASVHAFEPVPVTFAGLERQFGLQERGVRERMHAHNLGVGSRPGRMRFTTDQGTSNRLISDTEPYAGTTELIEVTTLDGIAAPRPIFIKIDVEGWTVPVLEGGAQVLSDPGLLALLIETFRFANWNDPEIQRVEAILAGHGFKPYRYEPVGRTLRPLLKPADGRQDTIYVRDPSVILERLRTATPVRCLGDIF
jgi:FkbM family methyltransferase